MHSSDWRNFNEQRGNPSKITLASKVILDLFIGQVKVEAVRLNCEKILT